MTLSTYMAIGACESPAATAEAVYQLCRALLNTPEDYEPSRTDANKDGIASVSHAPGLGLDAWLIVKYRPAGPCAPMPEPELPKGFSSVEEYDESEAYNDDYEDARYEWCWPLSNGFASIQVNWDTAYGFRDDQGRSCSDLHAGYIAVLGKWCDERGIDWRWQNEYQGKWYDRWDGLQEFGNYHDKPGGANDWFTGQVLPAIRGGLI